MFVPSSVYSMLLSEEDNIDLKEIRAFIYEYLKNGNERNELIKVYLEKTAKRDEDLLPFLWGRKYHALYAWETLKRNTEMRFVECPDLFPKTMPAKVLSHLEERQLLGVLKSKDNMGRHVVIFNAGAWDPEQCSLEEMLIVLIRFMERLLRDKDFAKNGFTYVQQCSGTGLKHARQYSLSAVRKLVKVFWHTFPIQLKSLHYVNVPNFLHFAFTVGRPFYPRKLKERLVISSVDTGYQELHSLVTPDKLPSFLGGKLSFDEAIEPIHSYV